MYAERHFLNLEYTLTCNSVRRDRSVVVLMRFRPEGYRGSGGGAVIVHGASKVLPPEAYYPGMRSVNSLPESEVVCLWQHRVQSGAVLATLHGEPVKVLYPGRMNDGHGADFRDAVVVIGGRMFKGDIEVHVRSGDWQAHGHHRDAAYDRVVLHVVMRHNDRTVTRLSSGRYVPEVALDRCAGADTGPASGCMACSGIARTGSKDRLGELLDIAGEARFLARTGGFHEDMEQMGAGQSLYRGVMGALGYSQNTQPLLELAERVPLDELETAARRAAAEEECLARIQSRLLGMAGLLPLLHRGYQLRDRLDDAGLAGLEELWRSSGSGKTMSPDAWHLFRVRPNNSPVRRLMAMSHLVCRYRGKGLLDGLLESLVEGCFDGGEHRHLEEGLVVGAGGYRGNRTRGPTLLGRRRAADIVVNVLLPFSFAWGRSTGRPDMAAGVLDIYRRYPRLAANALERHMKVQFGVEDGLVGSARRQQGLLHIYKTRCTQGRCPDCELGRVTRSAGGEKTAPLQDNLRLGTISRSRPSVLPARSWK